MTELQEPKPLVLVVDPCRSICITTALILERAGLEVVWADNFQRAMDIVRREVIYVLLIDLFSLFSDKFSPSEILKKARKSNPFCSAIVYTTEPNIEHYKPRMQTGELQGILQKPTITEDLRETIKHEMQMVMTRLRAEVGALSIYEINERASNARVKPRKAYLN